MIFFLKIQYQDQKRFNTSIRLIWFFFKYPIPRPKTFQNQNQAHMSFFKDPIQDQARVKLFLKYNTSIRLARFYFIF